MRRHLRRACLAAALGVAACGHPAPPPSPAAEPLDWHSLVGCYRTPETHFALDSIRATYLTLLSAPTGARQAWSYWFHGRNAYWRVLPGDTVEYVAGNSLYGGRYRWVVRGDSLVGRYDAWSDIVLPAPRRPPRISAHREPCSVDGPADAPPYNAAILFDSVPAAVAGVLVDSILPRLGGSGPIQVQYTDNPHSFSARIARIVGADPRIVHDPDVVYGTRLYATDVFPDRDRLSAVVVQWTCEDRPGKNLRVERTRFRWVVAGSAWRLVATERFEPADGICGAGLKVPPPLNGRPIP